MLFFDAVYCCPHQDRDNCSCKKPKTGMVDAACNDFDIELERFFVVGDMGMTDMVLARRINAKSVLVLTGVGKGSLGEFRHTWQDIEPDYVAQDILCAAKYIVSTLAQASR